MRIFEITDSDQILADFEKRVAAKPPRRGNTAYVVYNSKVVPVVVQDETDKFGGTHEVLVTSKDGHQGLLYPTFGKDLFKTEEEAKKALFKQELKGYPKFNAVKAPRW